MNEKSCGIILFSVMLALVFLLGGSVTGIAVQSGRIASLRKDVSRLESELGQYRDRAERLEDSERRLRETVDGARIIVGRAEESVSRIGSSVAEVRAGLAQLQEYVEELEDCLGDAGSVSDGRNGGDNSPCEEEVRCQNP